MSISSSIVVVFLLASIANSESSCPGNGFQAGSKCYLASKTTLTWFQAQEVKLKYFKINVPLVNETITVLLAKQWLFG